MKEIPSDAILLIVNAPAPIRLATRRAVGILLFAADAKRLGVLTAILAA
jgi:hypothetical protein